MKKAFSKLTAGALLAAVSLLPMAGCAHVERAHDRHEKIIEKAHERHKRMLPG